MSFLNVQDLYRRSEEDPLTGCWHFQGALSGDGNPRIHTLDYGRVEKRTMSGATAVWHIANKCCPPAGKMPYRSCFVNDCVNPGHLKLARDKAEIGAAISRNGKRKGTALPQRRASLKLAQAARGIVATPDPIVLAIRAAPVHVTGLALAAEFGVAQQTVSAIRSGKSHRHLLPAPVAFSEAT